MRSEEKIDKDSQTRRREFMKKVIYSAPVLIPMGQLVRPVKSSAETGIPDPPFGAAASPSTTNNSASSDPFKSSFDK